MQPSPLKYCFGTYTFSPAQQELRRGEDRRALTKSMNSLLLLFVRRPDEIITREQIAEELWPDHGTVDITAGINTAINRLRTVLGTNDGAGTFLETVVGSGYRFTAPVELIREPARQPIEETLPAEDEPPVLPPSAAQHPLEMIAAAGKPSETPRRSILPISGVIVCVLFVAALALWRLVRSRDRVAAPPSPSEMFTPVMQPVTYDDPVDGLTHQAISPSGRYIAYSQADGLFVKTRDGGTLRKLELPPGLATDRISWFPDESTLLVSGTMTASASGSPAGLRSVLWRVPILGSTLLKLADNAVAGAASPDGNKLIFLRAGETELWVADREGQAAHRIAQASQGGVFGAPVWSPRGDRIIVNRRAPPRFTMPQADVTTAGARQPVPPEDTAIYESFRVSDGTLLATQPGVRFESAVLLPNGFLYYVSSSPGKAPSVWLVQSDIATGAFRSAPVALSSKQVFSADFSSAEEISASTDGSVLSAILDRRATHLFVAEFTTDRAGKPALQREARWSRHTFTTFPSTWSRDGRLIVSDEGFLGPINVLGQSFEGAQTQVFAAAGPQDNYAQAYFSADGRWLMYLHLRGGVVQSIERVPAQGGPSEKVPNTAGLAEFRCSTSPAGRCLARAIEGKEKIAFYELDPVIGRGKLVASTPWRPAVFGGWSISPDGKTIASADHDPARPRVELLSTVNGAVRSIPILGYGAVLGVSWANNGQDLFVHTLSQNGYDALYLQSSGAVTLLRQSDELIWMVQSPDAKRVAYPLGTASNRNVWAGATQLGLR